MCENGTSCNILALIEHGIKFDPCCRTILSKCNHKGRLLWVPIPPPGHLQLGLDKGLLVAEEAGSGEGINELAGIIGGRFLGDLVATL